MNAPNPGGFAVGWGTLSLINAGLAQAKGRGGMNWFLLSLLLGPIATLLIVLTEPLSKERPLGDDRRDA